MPITRDVVLGLALCTLVSACARDAGADEGTYPHTYAALRALRDERPFQLRLNDEAVYRPCPASDTTPTIPAAGCLEASAAAAEALTRVSTALVADSGARTSTDGLWAAALLDLAVGRPDARQVDRAIRGLSEVHAREPAHVLPLNHLAIAYLIRARLRQDARDIFMALELLEDASARDSTSRSVAYNRAVVERTLRLNRIAGADWTRISDTEPDAAWRAAIVASRDSLPVLAASTPGNAISADEIARDPQRGRDFVVDSLLARWSAAVLSGDTARARSSYTVANSIAAQLAGLHTDSTVAHLAQAMRPPFDAATARAIGTLHRGISSFRLTAYGAARPAIDSAITVFRGRGAMALADWATTYIAGILTAERAYPAAIRMLSQVIDSAHHRHDRALAARATFARGIVVGRAGALDGAERDFIAAMRGFSSIDERRSAAQAMAAIADVQSLAGRARESATSVFRGFAASAALNGAVRYEELLFVAQNLSDAGRHHAAVRVLDEAIRSARDSKRAKDLPEALGRLAIVQVALRRHDLALATLTEARRLAGTVTDSTMHSRLDAELNRAESAALATRNPERALQLVDAAITHFRSTPSDLAGLLSRGGALAASIGDTVRAQRLLDSAVTMVASLAPTVPSSQSRQLVASSRESQRTLIAMALAHGDTTLAFERTRALSHLGGRARVGRVHTARSFGRTHAALRFVVLPQIVLTWLETDSGRVVRRVDVARDSVRGLVHRFVSRIRSGVNAASLTELDEPLSRILLGDLTQRIPAGTIVDVYNDDELASLPIALLRERNGRFLLERAAFREMVPTAASGKPAGKLASRVPLLIADPTWKRTDFPDLEPLRHADEEVRRVETLFPERVVVRHGGATHDEMQRLFPAHHVIHFAGHAVINANDPDRSYLVLARGRTFADGVLYASEVSAMSLDGVQLVVLSACGSVGENVVGLGGSNPLATAFLDAGSGTVVAGRWEVDDADAGALMVDMHSEIRGGADAAIALQRASIRLLSDRTTAARHLSTVAAFTVAVGTNRAGSLHTSTR
ncbi:MAG: CHAT domain-containing protein [Gemmatimonadaceae bacterium]|nr:CHAT domain-containing protein [Gemmatimonadaceae bacterium]